MYIISPSRGYIRIAIGWSICSEVWIGVGFINEDIGLFTSISMGALAYGTTVLILKVEEINVIINMVKSKLNKNKSKNRKMSLY